MTGGPASGCTWVKRFPEAESLNLAISSRSLPLASFLNPGYDQKLERCGVDRHTDPTKIENSIQMYLGSENTVWILYLKF